MDLLKDKTKEEILTEFEDYIKDRTEFHLGYPYNLNFEYHNLSRFMKYSINNLGDPFQESNYGVHSRQFELDILKFFSKLWKISDYWGYVTNSGTEGNLQSILVARENFPDGILYASKESHYSIFKAAKFYRMDAVLINTSWDGCIKLDELRQEISKRLDKPIIINVNIGTTVKGAVDNLDGVLGVLKQLGVPRSKFYIHCDGALFALILPFLNFENKLTVDFDKDIDSIAVSGHKFLGCPMPCGIMMTRKKLMEPLFQPIEYLNSVDSTITGSRNGQSSLYIWNVLVDKGIDGLSKDATAVMENSKYMINKMKQCDISCFKNNLSNTVIFQKPSDKIIKKWQLACTGNIAHVVVMPSVSKKKIDIFIEDLINDSYKKCCIKNEISFNCLCNKCI
jgi:histidine decarboxylase